jgi:restriction system protein
MDNLPRSQELLMPTLYAISKLGGEASIRDIESQVAQDLALHEDSMKVVHSGTRTEFQYRMAWARTKAKSLGYLESTGRKVWKLTQAGSTELTNQP